MIAAAQTAPIALDADEPWIEFTIAGVTFSVALVDALEELTIIDRRHLGDPHECLDCGHRWTTKDEQQAPPAAETDGLSRCLGCRSTNIVLAQLFLDDIARLLIERHKLTRCSRNAAGAYYRAVTESWTEAKKKRETTAALPTGTESTPAAGAG